MTGKQLKTNLGRQVEAMYLIDRAVFVGRMKDRNRKTRDVWVNFNDGSVLSVSVADGARLMLGEDCCGISPHALRMHVENGRWDRLAALISGYVHEAE